MENRIVTAVFKGSKNTKVSDVWQWDYGQVLRIQGLDLPTAVEVDFAVAGASESIARIGTTKDGVTDVVIPDSLIETGKNLVAYIYLRDSASGNTEYQIDMLVTKRAKPEAYDRPEDKELFGQAIEAVNTAADRAEKAGQAAQEAAQKAGLDAEQTAQDRAEVAKMVETVADISEQVKKVEELSNKAQESATQAGASAVATEKAKAQAETAAGKTAEDRIAVNQAKIAVDEVQEAVRADRAAVEEVKQSVEQLSNAIPESTQAGVQAVNQARQTAVDEIARTGTSHKTAVEGAGTQAVESVENVQQVATEAVETAKTEAVQAVQAEGAKQIKEVQDKGAEVLQSIPEDFATQMETKLNKQQGIENKGKVLVIEEDGNVVPGEVASGGGDGIAIINTMSGESPLVIPDSAERVNKRLELGGKTEQVQTTGANLFDEKLLLDFDSENYNKTQSGSGFYYYKFPVNGTVTVSTKNVNKNGEYLTVGIKPDGSDKTWLSHGSAYISKYKTLTPEDGNIYLGVNNNLERVKSMIQNAGGIIINEGSVAKPYEPYTDGKPSPSPEYPQEIKNSGKWNEEKQKYEIVMQVKGADTELQSLTLTSDRPLTKWDRLVEQGGEIGWLYKSRIAEIPKTGYALKNTNENRYGVYFSKSSIFKDAVVTKGSPEKDSNIFTHFKPGNPYASNGNIAWLYVAGGNTDLRIKVDDETINTVELFEQYISDKDIKILYETESTEFVSLLEEEQNAIRALKTYYPTTVITVDGGELDPDIKVTYTADTKNYIDGKVSAKVASILRQYQADTANLLSLMPMETQATMIENDTNNILNNLESEEAHE